MTLFYHMAPRGDEPFNVLCHLLFTKLPGTLSVQAVETYYFHKRGERVIWKIVILKKEPWLVWLSWLECRPIHQKVEGSIPGQAHT